jgi:hypothetical protein
VNLINPATGLRPLPTLNDGSAASAGLPINVWVTRKATDVPDGNVLSTQRPDLVPGRKYELHIQLWSHHVGD